VLGSAAWSASVEKYLPRVIGYPMPQMIALHGWRTESVLKRLFGPLYLEIYTLGPQWTWEL